MNMHPQDQNLLLLAHGELSFAHGTLLQAHLLLCPRCRQRVARFQNTSHVVAGAIRGPGLPTWPGPPAAATLALQVLAGWLLVLMVTLSLTALVVFGALRLSHHAATRAATPPASSSGGCRPDLPSDQCQ